MRLRMFRAGFALFGLLTALPPSAAAADGTIENKPVVPSYLKVGDVVGEITKIDKPDQPGGSITLRVTWYTAQPPRNTGRNNMGHWHRGSTARSPQQMYQHMMQMQQQMMRQAAQQAQRAANTKVKEQHRDYVLKTAVDVHARTRKPIPTEFDENGKPKTLSPDAVLKLKGTSGLPGYKADLAELKVGQIVEVHVVRLKSPPKEEANEVFARWVLILDDSKAKNAPPPAPKKGKKN